MKGNKEKSYTAYYIAIMVAGFVTYKIWQFANRPDALEQTLNFLGGVALCFGAFVLFFVLFMVVLRIVPCPYEEDAARTKPAVDTGYGLIRNGVFFALVSLGFCYLFVHGLIDESGSIRTIRDTNLFDICAGLYGVLFTLFIGVGSIYMIGTGILTLLDERHHQGPRHHR